MLLIKYVNKYCMVLTASQYKGSMKSLRLRKVNKKTYIKEEQTIQWREEKKDKQWSTKQFAFDCSTVKPWYK